MLGRYRCPKCGHTSIATARVLDDEFCVRCMTTMVKESEESTVVLKEGDIMELTLDVQVPVEKEEG